jgi:hypothetical protein
MWRWNEKWQVKLKYPRQPIPVPLYAPQIPYDLTWETVWDRRTDGRRDIYTRLLCTMYKVCANIIERSIGTVMDPLIQEGQNWYREDRSCRDNVFILQC